MSVGASRLAAQGPATEAGAVPTPTPTPNIEERKLTLEYEKLKVERLKSWLSALPLLAALATLTYSIWSFRRQLKENARQQREAAKLQFEIKAAEIAFSGKTPEEI